MPSAGSDPARSAASTSRPLRGRRPRSHGREEECGRKPVAVSGARVPGLIEVRTIPLSPFPPDHSGRSGTEPSFFHRPGVACGAWRGLTYDSQDLPYRKRFADPLAALIYAG